MIRTAVKFGLFVALCTLFLLYLASTIGNTSIGGLVGQGEETISLSASFTDVSGLLVGDNVKVAGVPVGKVSGIDVEDGRSGGATSSASATSTSSRAMLPPRSPTATASRTPPA